VVAMLVALCLWNSDRHTNNDLEIANKGLLKWLQTGKYFTYKDKYKIFYVLKSRNKDDESLVSLVGKPNGRACTVNVFLHGYPTASYDFIKIFNLFLNSNDGE
jgi:hypothetical protein